MKNTVVRAPSSPSSNVIIPKITRELLRARRASSVRVTIVRVKSGLPIRFWIEITVDSVLNPRFNDDSLYHHHHQCFSRGEFISKIRRNGFEMKNVNAKERGNLAVRVDG